MSQHNIHKFHIPVLGTGFSIDTAVKVSKYGISSVISLVDDTLMEELRKHYSEKYNFEYVPISLKEEDARARRVTAYLNLIKEIVDIQFNNLKNSSLEENEEIKKYFDMLPDDSLLKKDYLLYVNADDKNFKKEIEALLRDKIKPGSIDVNIMTKLDKANTGPDDEFLPSEFNDAHAGLRGYANSKLESSVIFSAGMNPRLYGYMSSFKDFFPDNHGKFKKKIVIKVSDFRSALIQGKFLAKKGLWVSEYRIESGLNCGGHAFATDGYLLGPILEEFKVRKNELIMTVGEMFIKALNEKGIHYNENNLDYDLTVQGGVGKSTEQDFLIRRYGVKSVGWGSPFLLVPEVMNVDEYTLDKLSRAGVKDFYLSNASPLGVPFNNLRNSEKEIEKLEKAAIGKPGSPCPKKYLVSNKEYTDKPICSASISYLNKKINELKEKFDHTDYKKEYDKAITKECLCVGLASSALKVNNIETPKMSQAVSICPGPNLAYFSKISTLKEMVDHIYGKIDLITDPNRPNMFIKELTLYIEYLINKIEEGLIPLTTQTEEFFNTFHKNLMDGIKYYKNLIPDIIEETEKVKKKINEDLEVLENKLLSFVASFA
ncbi:MAG: hypothetical protein KJ571_02700 [Bacteroidetes bacterium]|nr:hypothetical protein [Bacteroidota bacterium]